MFSLIHPNTPVKVDMGKIHSLQKKIVGKKIIDPLPLFEAVFHFEQFGKAMETAARPETYKVIGKFFNRRTNRQKTKIKLANDSSRLENVQESLTPFRLKLSRGWNRLSIDGAETTAIYFLSAIPAKNR